MSFTPSAKPQKSPPVVLTIAGSDSSGGAGIQADIKTFSATGSYACSVITAITAQNTQGVSAVYPLPAEQVAAQIDAVFSDLHIAAVKVGMLGDAAIVQVVADKIRQYRPKNLVIDPVLVSTSGRALLQPDAIDIFKHSLLPMATIVTPNLPEAAALTHMPIDNCERDLPILVEKLRTLGAQAVLLKGGHRETGDQSNDVLITASDTKLFTGKRYPTHNTHGTGCTLSSALASYLAQGESMLEAVTLAKHYISQAIAHADLLQVGRGSGPVNHFFPLL